MARAKRPTPPRSSSARDPVGRYALAVVGGKIKAGRLVRLACERHLRDLVEGPARGLKWDRPAAQRALDFFPEVLRLAEGEHAGAPFVLQPWQAFIIGSLFGWKAPDGFRRFRNAYVEIGKGNGKSPMAGGVGLYMLTADGEASAECYAAATTREQAGILFRDAVAMVDQSPELSERVAKSGKRQPFNLAHLASGSYFRPVSAEGRALDGKRVHYAALDEVHEHPNGIVVDKMRAGTKGRRQALILEITNSGYDRNTVCYQHHDYSRRVLEGAAENDSWFAYVCGLDEGDDWRDERCWLKANPNLGVSITRKYLREQVAEAVGMPSKASIVRRLNFCEWVEAAQPWIDRDRWMACLADLDLEALRGRPCFAGLDLSGKNDLTALALAWQAEDGTIDAAVRYWTPEDTLREREDRDRVPYRQWRDEGWLLTVPGRSIDYAWVARDLGEVEATHELVDVGFDRWRIDDLLRELDEAGIEAYLGSEKMPAKRRGIRLTAHGQGFQDMGPAVDALETAVLNGTLRIQRNPVTTMCSANAVLDTDPAGNRKFTKAKSIGRIDGIVALAMAVRLASSTDPPKPSVYATRGILSI